ncbi:hypothetical protein HN784_01855 [bacterium]|jgi:hypothetical protein|nr:hypothetical protein [bacterium]MBT4251242.1 hypothetical protein [bacterium]MBT4598377.1 hypothetical protein [bacterium]MBT6754210.1 hypothetical protein [bacterium]MBT7038019.1 hypothetical protein [bacterium]
MNTYIVGMSVLFVLLTIAIGGFIYCFWIAINNRIVNFIQRNGGKWVSDRTYLELQASSGVLEIGYLNHPITKFGLSYSEEREVSGIKKAYVETVYTLKKCWRGYKKEKILCLPPATA